jgi:hypothetical protein
MRALVRPLVLTLSIGFVAVTLAACKGDGGSGGGGGGGSGGGGSPPDGPTCIDTATCVDVLADFQACGGDLTGTWTYKNRCSVLDFDDPDAECPERVSASAILHGTGDVTFDGASITWGDPSTVTAFIRLEIPKSCFPLSCDVAEQQLLEQGVDVVCCEDVGTACVCEATKVEPLDPAPPSAYTISGSTITGDLGSGEFCVRPNGELWLRTQVGTKDELVGVYVKK